jgi:hypothetical protein
MRESDRWVTPRVVVAGLAGVVLIVIAAIGAVTYLSAIHVDPSPMLKLVGAVAAGASGVLSLVVQLVNRRTIAKTEAQAGRLATHVGDLVDVVAAPPAAGQYDDDPSTGYVPADPWERTHLPPVPPPDARRPRHREGGEPAR